MVVGAGVVGASIAHHAARRGARVTLVERGAPACGATGASFGWIGAHGEWPGGARDLRTGVLAHWRRLEREVPGVRVRWSGSLSWPRRWGRDDGSGAGEDDAEDDVEVLAAAGAAALEPALRRLPRRAVHVRSDGAVDAAAVTTALVAAARARGARLLTGTEVLALRAAGGRVAGVQTSAGFLAADRVVLAAGVDVPRLCAGAGVEVPVAASPAVLVRFEAPAGLVRTLVDAPGVEVRQDEDGALLASVAWPGDGERALAGAVQRTADAVAATFRGAGDLARRTARTGVRPLPPGGPVVGPLPGVAGVHVVVAHSGVCLAPLLGHLVAGEVVDGLVAPQLRGCRAAGNPGDPRDPGNPGDAGGSGVRGSTAG
nr:FAD-binding oxidoreductase [Kineococcus vitellinus]